MKFHRDPPLKMASSSGWWRFHPGNHRIPGVFFVENMWAILQTAHSSRVIGFPIAIAHMKGSIWPYNPGTYLQLSSFWNDDLETTSTRTLSIQRWGKYKEVQIHGEIDLSKHVEPWKTWDLRALMFDVCRPRQFIPPCSPPVGQPKR